MTFNNKIAKVADNPDLVRDLTTKAILQTNTEKLNEHRQKKAMLKGVMNHGQEIENLKKEIGEIKDLLYKILSDK